MVQGEPSEVIQILSFDIPISLASLVRIVNWNQTVRSAEQFPSSEQSREVRVQTGYVDEPARPGILEPFTSS
jgi:hypothetical protein